jgi:hypothetical protein
MSSAAYAGVGAVWAVNDGERVDRDDLANANKKANSVWDGQKIRLFAARNEVVAFQVITESDDQGIKQLSAALPELAGPDGKARIAYAPPREDPTDYVGRPIQVFTAHYIEVKKPTNCKWIYELGSPAAPPKPTGWKGEILVPENARAGRGGFPLTVPANSSQSIWFEIYTAKNLPAGLYKGTVTLTIDDAKKELPVELEVLDFTLPDQNSMKAMLYFEGDQVELYQGRNFDDRYHRFAHRQRVEFVERYDVERAKQLMGRFDGKAFSAANHYEGPGENTGNVIIPASFYGTGPAYETADGAHKASDEWMSFINATLPKTTTFLYLPDEPRPRDFPKILELGQNVHGGAGPGAKLPTFVTHSVIEGIAPAVDIWCVPTETYDPVKSAAQRQAGKQVWVYNGKRPAAGAPVYDCPATDIRATIWGCFKYEIPLYFYWHSDHWQHNSQKPTNREQNVWLDSVTFDNRKQDDPQDAGAANGDGVLLYPGQEKLHPDQDRGIAGPCGSVRLVNLRRGLQDHLYLTLAKQLKQDATVTECVNSVTGRMFKEAGTTVEFAQTGNEFEAARLKLAKAIVAAQAASRPAEKK